MVALQEHLDAKYPGGGYLIDKLLTTVDIRDIQAELADPITIMAQHAIQRIENRLSEQPRTSRSITSTLLVENTGEESELNAMY